MHRIVSTAILLSLLVTPAFAQGVEFFAVLSGGNEVDTGSKTSSTGPAELGSHTVKTTTDVFDPGRSPDQSAAEDRLSDQQDNLDIDIKLDPDLD